MKKNELNLLYASDSIQQEKLPITLEVKLIEYTFNHYTYLWQDVRCKRSKQTVHASQQYKIPSC